MYKYQSSQFMNFRSYVIFLGFLICHLSVFAASFDCANAKTPREKIICKDPELSALDAQLGSKYEERLKLLSPEGVKLFQRSEHNWLHFISTVCPIARNSKSDNWHNPKECLTQEYMTRLKEINMVGQKIGPFIFNRIDLYAARIAPDQDGSRSGFYYQHVAYPQIDNQLNEISTHWNRMMEKKLESNGDCGRYGDYNKDYEIGYASNILISMTWFDGAYCHGTPHGFGGSQPVTIALTPVPHKFTSSDLFGSSQDWKPKLQAFFMDGLLKEGWKPKSQQDKKTALEIVIDPSRWLFTEKGIEVYFQPYEICEYACTPQPVTVSWKNIKPLLHSALVVP